jgi:hypothetical protein
MKSKLLVLLLLTSSGIIAQKLPREMLYGQLVVESMAVDNILITNKSANIAAVSKKDGTFQIFVRVKDTLVFSGLNFPRQSLILNESDLKFKVLKIKIESRATNLDEVIINPKALSGDLTRDSKNIKLTTVKPNLDNSTAMATLYEADTQTAPDNKLMAGYLDDTYMTDFVAIGKKLIRSVRRSEAQKNRDMNISEFSVKVKNRFSDDFFRNTMKMNEAETTEFLIFCNNDSKANEKFANGNDFELINFLKLKKQEFMELKKE